MRVVLPDNSELELPDGATGLDAARAIGPKLADEAVLVRSNGRVQDLRRSLEDGQEVQIVTTRDSQDPDALAVLRHSSAHLLAEAVRRLLARRREEQAADAHLRDGVLLPGRSGRLPRAGGGGEAAGPPPARCSARSLPPLRRLARSAVLAPEGSDDLEQARSATAAHE